VVACPCCGKAIDRRQFDAILDSKPWHRSGQPAMFIRCNTTGHLLISRNFARGGPNETVQQPMPFELLHPGQPTLGALPRSSRPAPPRSRPFLCRSDGAHGGRRVQGPTSRREPFDKPFRLLAPGVAQAVVQPAGPTLPEFDRLRNQPESAPVGGSGDRAILETFFQFLASDFE
jgi:hypothetical protein